MKTVAVIYAPYQIPLVYQEPIQLVDRENSILIFVLPVKRFPNSKTAPLDFHTRQQMLHTACPKAMILPLPEEKCPENWVKKLESLVSGVLSSPSKITLYTSVEECHCYHANGGIWQSKIFSSVPDISYWKKDPLPPKEAVCRKYVQSPIDSVDFRKGVIYALNSRFPVSWLTVDMAVIRPGKKEVLLGRKPGEQLWRFPGGFKDRSDSNLEMSVHRELMEEVMKGMNGMASNEFFTSPSYVGSTNINDWRYAGDEDGITTVLFEVEFFGDLTKIQAGDDLEEVLWFDIDCVSPKILVAEHIKLWKLWVGPKETEPPIQKQKGTRKKK